MRKTITAACAVAALAALPASASAATRMVYAGGTPKFAKALGVAGVNNFLTNTVTVHAGDTVKWDLNSGFHTVDIPKLGGSDLPLILPTGQKVSGVKDAAGNDFWFDGKVPAVGFNGLLFSRSGPAAYNGTTRVDSGLPVGPGSHVFSLKFLTPGRYKYFCDVHPGMVGYVVVKAKGRPVPSASAVAAELGRQQAKYAAEARRVERTKVPADSVSLGLSGPGGLEAFAMYPATLTVKVGTTVRFSMSKDSRETHSATFGPAGYIKSLAGSFQGPAPAPAAVYPSDVPPNIVLSSTSHGNGFANTGVLDQDPASRQPSASAIKFTQAGTYHFICVIHEFMRGTIIVK